MFRPHWVCPAQGCLCFPVYTAQAPGCSIWSGPCVECGSSFRVLHKNADLVAPVFCAFPGLSGSGSQRLGALSTGAPRPIPPRPQRAAGRASGSLQTGPGACLPGGRGWLLWGSVCPLSPPLSCLQRGWGGSSPQFLSPLVLRTAGGVFQPVNFSSLSHSLKELPPTALRAFGLVLTLSNAAGSSPSAPTCWWRVRASGVLFCWELLLARNLWGLFNFSSQLGCPLRFESFSQTRQREGFLVIGNFL